MIDWVRDRGWGHNPKARPVTRADFRRFQAVQNSGLYTMDSERARRAALLPVGKYLDIQENFAAYLEKWGEWS